LSAPPKTELVVDAQEQSAIRAAVRSADVALLGQGYTIATVDHVDGLVSLLSDPAVSDPIYDLPRPFSANTVGAWIADAAKKRDRGEAILAVLVDGSGEVIAYSYFTVWPDRSAAEIAGAQRADMQNRGIGKAGAARSFGWMFDRLGVRLIGLTAALDNARSAKVIEAAGFEPMGERDSRKPDGSIRRSRYWELTKDKWLALHSG
jgi:RimJ/RimL family protein N-acetyltransferase